MNTLTKLKEQQNEISKKIENEENKLLHAVCTIQKNWRIYKLGLISSLESILNENKSYLDNTKILLSGGGIELSLRDYLEEDEEDEEENSDEEDTKIGEYYYNRELRFNVRHGDLSLTIEEILIPLVNILKKQERRIKFLESKMKQ